MTATSPYLNRPKRSEAEAPVNLAPLLAAANAARAAFESEVPKHFPGNDRWHWSRACAAMRGENCRRNDDTSNDEALAAHPEIRAAYDAYITALHVYYRARDGEHGFLGSRGV
jgi:hypothetical protein